MKLQFMKRFILSAIILWASGIGLMVRLLVIQNSDAADKIRIRNNPLLGWEMTVYPRRGDIYDRYGALLAGNQMAYEVGLNLAIREYNVPIDANLYAMTISKVVEGIDIKFLVEWIEEHKNNQELNYLTLVPVVTPEQKEELSQFQKAYQDANGKYGEDMGPNLEGLYFSPILVRSYPEKDLASNILGYYAFYQVGSLKASGGVEEEYNSSLAGTPRKMWFTNDPLSETVNEELPPGDSLILTIDRNIQARLEEILSQGLEQYGAESGVILVMDPSNGEILGIANSERMDLNQYMNFEDYFPNATFFNRSVSVTYEPGSVFKVLTVAAGLDAGAITPESTYNDIGYIRVGGADIYNWNYMAFGQQDITGCLQNSINCCMADIAVKLGNEQFYYYLQQFGIGHLTGVDLAQEAYYPLRLPGGNWWSPSDLGTNAFGQGVAVTPMQMVMAISAIANRQGKMMIPHVVKAKITNGWQQNVASQPAGYPIKPETAATLSDMLANSVKGESYEKALVEGYRLAGKTGTAQVVVNGQYSESLTNASFVGWGPVDDARFLVYIWLEKPSTSIWGSETAAPLFHDVVQSLVVLMDIPPDDIRLGISRP